MELRILPNELLVRHYSRFYAQLSLRDYDNANEFLLCYYRAASIFRPINSSRTESRLRSCLPLTILVVRAKQQIQSTTSLPLIVRKELHIKLNPKRYKSLIKLRCPINYYINRTVSLRGTATAARPGRQCATRWQYRFALIRRVCGNQKSFCAQGNLGFP